jgi:hypothetical protein
LQQFENELIYSLPESKLVQFGVVVVAGIQYWEYLTDFARAVGLIDIYLYSVLEYFSIGGG